MGIGPIMLGLFKDENFAFARAILEMESPVSVVVERVAEDLRCIESLDRSFTVEVPSIGSFEVYAICVVDRALIDGSEIDVKSVLHVGKPRVLLREPLEYEAILGKDLVFHWDLVYDELTGTVRSSLAKPITKRY